MVGSRGRGPLGAAPEVDDLRDGTLVRQPSRRPGVMTGHAIASGQGGVVLSRVMPGPPTLRAVSARPAVHVQRRGSQGFEVQKLQRQINARLTPFPGLVIDAVFGPLTEQAVIEYQKGVFIVADGIVGGHTWYYLLKGDTAVMAQPPAVRQKLAGIDLTNAAKNVVKAPMVSTALPAALGIWEWPLDRKFADVLQRTAPKLPANMRHEFLGLLSPTNIAIMTTCLVAWAGSHAFGVGEAIDVLLVGVGLLFVGMAIIDVANEVGDCVIETTGATEEKDLEAAASHLARAIAIIGVLAFIALFAKVARGLGRKRVGGGEAPAKPPTSEPRTRVVEPKENVKPKPKPKDAAAQPEDVPAKVSIARTEPTGEVGGKPEGNPKEVLPQDDASTQRSAQRENESAVKLSEAGYKVKQLPESKGQKNPDYNIEGNKFDCKAPSTDKPRNVASEISRAVDKGQADRIVLNLEDSPISLDSMKQQLTDHPIEGLKEVIVIKHGQVTSLWP